MIPEPSRLVVGVSDMKLSNKEGSVVVTHALGSCIAITIYDPVAVVGGMLHFQLPTSSRESDQQHANPLMYADTAIPQLFLESYKLGANKKRLIVKAAGGGRAHDGPDMFEIGKRNNIYMRKIFWKNNILLKGEFIGNSHPVTMWLEIGSGKTFVRMKDQTLEI